MKKLVLFTLFSGLFVILQVRSQSNRLVLLEHFTQASCPPCATWNPIIQGIVEGNPDKITYVKYHVSWPGFDPMYLHNTVDINARVDYYNVSSVPNSVLDGNYYNGHPQGWNLNSVITRQSVPSPFEIQLYQVLSPNQDSIYLTALIEAVGNVSGELKAHLVVIEKHVHFANPPGTNGENDFYHVVKKMLPTKNGTTLLSSMVAGDYTIIQAAWKLANVYSVPELASVAFVQNNGTKEVHQAANSSSNPVIPLYTNDAEIIAIDNVPEKNCSGMVDPYVKIRNNGSANLTALKIYYYVNGEQPAMYQWNGNLGFLESETIMLPGIDFTLQQDNELVVYSDDPNGLSDDYVKNDTLHHTFDKAVVSSSAVRVVIITDDNPQEISWDIKNPDNEIIFSGSNYTQAGHIYQENYEITESGCYKFTIYDAGGNGLCCAYGQGAWGVYNGNTELGKGGIFTERDSTYFLISMGTGIEKPVSKTVRLNIQPIPANEYIGIDFYLSDPGNCDFRIFDMMGKEIYFEQAGNWQLGNNHHDIDVSSLPEGIYYLQLNNRVDHLSKKFIVID